MQAITEIPAVVLPELQLQFAQDSDIDRAEQEARSLLKFCDNIDLETQIRRGRIIRAIADLHRLKECSSRTESWLKDLGLTPKKANELIQAANQADGLMEAGTLTEIGLKNISSRAFIETANKAPEATPAIVSDAENGVKVGVDYARRIVCEQTVNSADVSENFKQLVEDGGFKAKAAVKLLENIDEITQEEAITQEYGAKLKQELDSISGDAVRVIAENAQALRKIEETAPYCTILQQEELGVERLIEECHQLEALPLLASVLASIKDIETLAAKLSSKLSIFEKNSDRLYVETGAGQVETRKLVDLLKAPEGFRVPLKIAENLQIEVTVVESNAG